MTQETPGAVTPAVLAPADPESAVRDALGLLDGLEDVPPADHVARFEAVHDALRAQLSGDSGR
ncbi:hypothetical protein [Antribacter gilvus]|uniref:hypothetical protein n=1 Tax=Antribacter gilvus TaxID=2304675 RepID=UPI000F77C9B8|nr:hypothetical protein [Antribacter gilvus]